MVNINEALEKAKREQQAQRERQQAETSFINAGKHQVPEPVSPAPTAIETQPLPPLDPRIVVYFEPESLAAEQFRKVCLALTNRTDRSIQTLTITSALRGEGRSTVTANLAALLASAPDRRVLAIDADLRKPALANMLGASSRPGLSDLLSERFEGSQIEKIIQPTAINHLDVLPGGGPTPNSTELLGSEVLCQIINQLKQKYTHILIDTPPAVAVSDALVVGKITDGALLVVQAGNTRREIAQRAGTRLEEAQIPILGCILNGVEYTDSESVYRQV